MDHTIEAIQKRAAADPRVISLAGGLPDPLLLPTAPITIPRDALQYGWVEGERALRAWVASRLRARGASIDPDEVVITAGAQQALALAASGALARGARISVGDATYPGALEAFQHAGAIACASSSSCDVAYVMPTVANPTGQVCVPAVDVVTIADEAYAELRFDGTIDPPLCARDRDRVWHIGTVSKTLSPGLRIGWLVPPPGRLAEVIDRKHALDLQASSLGQAALLSLLASIDYDAHVARARSSYARRADAALTALRAHAPPSWRYEAPRGGFSIWIETARTDDDLTCLHRALAAGVTIDPGCLFRPPSLRAPFAFRLSFSSVPLADLAPAIARLARAL
ncbi:MAG TPA: PLP-dependent aminotransferase family protein [Kofleriaceae bacterium]|nr:PLP-dependent aminotransferase family protein [Kofleriaceae bacterium]